MSTDTATDIEVYEAPHTRGDLTVAPLIGASDLVARLDVIRSAMQQAMQPDVDYGVIPGTGSKPTLLKPGAEKLGALFQLDVQLANEKIWHDDGHLTVICRATVYHQPTGTRLGSGEGICSTREAKYAYRTAERTCPVCKQAAIIKGKAEYGGGWVCFKKKGGCGAKFGDGEPSIEKQQVGKVANDAIADTYNTVDKMASKRARVDAVLAVTGASALFTQDLEDLAAPATPPPAEAATAYEPPSDTELVTAPAASEGKLKKLNVLVGQLRESDHDPTEWVYTQLGREPVRDEEGRALWSPLREKLTDPEAAWLIETLEAMQQKIGAAQVPA